MSTSTIHLSSLHQSLICQPAQCHLRIYQAPTTVFTSVDCIVDLKSGRSRVRIMLVTGFFLGRIIPVATLPGAERYRVSARNGQPGGSIL